MTWNDADWTPEAARRVSHDELGAAIAVVMTSAADGRLTRTDLNSALAEIAVKGADDAALRRVNDMAVHLVKLFASLDGAGNIARSQLFPLRQIPARFAFSELRMRDAREDLSGQTTASPMVPADVDGLIAQVSGSVTIPTTLNDPAQIAEKLSRGLFGTAGDGPAQ